MQYHAMSLSKQAGFAVDLVGHAGSPVFEGIVSDPNIRVRTVSAPLWTERVGWRPLALLLKALLQALALFWALVFALSRPDVILVQVPPAVPTLPICLLAARLRGARIVVDWHNLGYTLLALKMGPKHPLVALYAWIERVFGRAADGHLTVTEAMRDHLSLTWGMRNPPGNMGVFHDRPASTFRRLHAPEAAELLQRLRVVLEHSDGRASEGSGCDLFCTNTHPDGRAWYGEGANGRALTPWTDGAAWRPRRPALLVSGTSWTPDEDFGILLDAAIAYDKEVRAERARGGASQLGTRGTGREGGEESGGGSGDRLLPDLVIIVTGKGPLRDHYTSRMADLDLRHVAFRCAWLAAEDYPRLLGAADLGVSLHQSSSGIDLPMKVVDMFGCGLPALSRSFACVGELVKAGVNGELFDTPQELSGLLVRVLRGFPDAAPAVYHALREGAAREARAGWGAEWERCALPMLGGRDKRA
ncbi:unnamed protein product [Pedinophyceae sp. YPF-701]|nr:unnamed protein product [Pedinophyceae sp. YPF-701]